MASPVASAMFSKCIHTNIHHIDCIDYIKCRVLQHFLAKLDARKSDDPTKGAIKSLQEI